MIIYLMYLLGLYYVVLALLSFVFVVGFEHPKDGVKSQMCRGEFCPTGK